MKALVFSFFLSFLLSCEHHYRKYPVWRIRSASEFKAGLAVGKATIIRSGKEGIGIVLVFERAPLIPQEREVKLGRLRAELHLAERVIEASPVSADSTLTKFDLFHGIALQAYFAFSFDNNGVWNEAIRNGKLVVHEDGPNSMRFEYNLTYDGWSSSL